MRQITMNLIRKAIAKNDWDLAMELSKFHIGAAIDKRAAIRCLQALSCAEGVE